jgi:hypothetical protein
MTSAAQRKKKQSPSVMNVNFFPKDFFHRGGCHNNATTYDVG